MQVFRHRRLTMPRQHPCHLKRQQSQAPMSHPYSWQSFSPQPASCFLQVRPASRRPCREVRDLHGRHLPASRPRQDTCHRGQPPPVRQVGFSTVPSSSASSRASWKPARPHRERSEERPVQRAPTIAMPTARTRLSHGADLHQRRQQPLPRLRQGQQGRRLCGLRQGWQGQRRRNDVRSLPDQFRGRSQDVPATPLSNQLRHHRQATDHPPIPKA